MGNECLEVFGQRLKSLREEQELSQRALAEVIGISKGAVYYYENEGRAADIVTLKKLSDFFGVSADYLLGSTNARTQSPKLKNLCDLVGLSDTAVNMLAKLKKNKSSRLRIINYLLEQAADDIEDDYELEGEYEGSLLNAVCRYMARYNSYDSVLAELTSSSDELSSTIHAAVQRIFYEQACTALRNSADEIAADIYNKAVRE